MKHKFFSILCLLFVVSTVFAQKEYYSSIDGLKGGETLKTALHNLIKEHSVIKYGSGVSSNGKYRTWGAFYTTDFIIDEDGERVVFDMYSNTKRYFGEKGASVSGMHIEHSVPKSWWSGGDEVEGPYSDLHHLRPADGSANLKKSNHPLAELASVTWTNGVSSIGKIMFESDSITAFEPSDEYKGDFARMYMYMFTCYQDLTWEHTYMNYTNSTYPTLKPDAIEMLLKWHKQDPVCKREINRNNEVYDIQGNRNPYIDYPQLAEFVWGDSIGYNFNLSEVAGGVDDEESVAGEVTDVLDQALVGVVVGTYKEWSGKEAVSGAAYSGISAGSNGSIQLRSDKSSSCSGIITTKSGGRIRKVVVEWNSKTIAGRTLDIYGKNTAYTSTADLYDAENQGTKLGTIVCETSTELEVEGDYRYIGLRSNSGAMYLLSIEITWQTTSDDDNGDSTGENGASVKDLCNDAVGQSVVFDISGRQLSNMAVPGLYIVNGKKIVLK